MLYTENIDLWDCSGFLQIESHISCTIKVYLSAAQHMHVSAGLHHFFNVQLTPCLQLTLKGMQKSQASAQPTRVWLPITLQIMGNIKVLLAKQPRFYTTIMIWVTCCLAFFSSCESVNSPSLPMISLVSHATCPSTVCQVTTETTHNN